MPSPFENCRRGISRGFEEMSWLSRGFCERKLFLENADNYSKSGLFEGGKDNEHQSDI